MREYLNEGRLQCFKHRASKTLQCSRHQPILRSMNPGPRSDTSNPVKDALPSVEQDFLVSCTFVCLATKIDRRLLLFQVETLNRLACPGCVCMFVSRARIFICVLLGIHYASLWPHQDGELTRLLPIQLFRLRG